ncbi:hemolysin III family protein [Legionella beliardensis]
MIYAFKWPDPFPSVFEYHEVFHILLVVGSGLL